MVSMPEKSFSTLNGSWRRNWSFASASPAPPLPAACATERCPSAPVSPKSLPHPSKYFLKSLSALDFAFDGSVLQAEDPAAALAPDAVAPAGDIAPAQVEDETAAPATAGNGRLPPELLCLVFELAVSDVSKYTLDAVSEDLKACALVCRAWTNPAQRALFGAFPQAITSTAHLAQLRRALEASPELVKYIKNVDLSDSSSWREPKRRNDFFRRAAGLLRQTRNLEQLALLHVALSPAARARFFGALGKLTKVRVLNLMLASSAPWATGAGRSSARSAAHHAAAAREALADMVALCSTLAQWSRLEQLHLHGYNQHTCNLATRAVLSPRYRTPTYRLRSLHLVSTAVCPATLLFLLGTSHASLEHLSISSVTGLTPAVLNQVFELVGGSLKVLSLSVDLEDFARDEASAVGAVTPLDGSCFRHLVALESLTISTDAVFTPELFIHLATLPRLRNLSLCFPAFNFEAVSAFLRDPPPALGELALDPWEATPATDWTDQQRWTVLDTCESKGISFALNGVSKQAIEDGWYGLDLGACERTLELDWPQGRAPLGPRSWWQS